LVLRFDSSELITQAGSFGTILSGFDTVLDCANAAHRIEDLDDSAAPAVAGMRELVDEIVLVQGLGLSFVNTTVKIPDTSPALRLRDDSIADSDSGILPLSAVVGLLLFRAYFANAQIGGVV
jgi:hypothetical protein